MDNWRDYPCRIGTIRKKPNSYNEHRRIWSQNYGPIPSCVVVMHFCDNPPCIEINHLKLGTQSENMIDASMKGRIRKKLNKEDVLLIRGMIGSFSYRKIAKDFGINVSSVVDIVRGRFHDYDR